MQLFCQHIAFTNVHKIYTQWSIDINIYNLVSLLNFWRAAYSEYIGIRIRIESAHTCDRHTEPSLQGLPSATTAAQHIEEPVKYVMQDDRGIILLFQMVWQRWFNDIFFHLSIVLDTEQYKYVFFFRSFLSQFLGLSAQGNFLPSLSKIIFTVTPLLTTWRSMRSEAGTDKTINFETQLIPIILQALDRYWFWYRY